MKKTPEQQEKSKLASKLHKANGRMHKAAEDLSLAKQATNANSKSGKSTTKKREKGLEEAIRAHSGALRDALDDGLPSAPPGPPRKRLGQD